MDCAIRWWLSVRRIDPHKFDYLLEEETRYPMSLQIRDAANPATRQELRERIRGMVDRLRELVAAELSGNVRMPEGETKATEEVRALYLALTGYGATGEEMSQMTGEKYEAAGEQAGASGGDKPIPF